MKNYLLFLIAVFAIYTAQAQKIDAYTGATEMTVNTGENYAYEVYWGFENHDVAKVLRSSWEIAFATDKMDVNILANNGLGVRLYTYPNGTIEDWDAVDTTDMEWKPLFNSITTWSEGAFLKNKNTNDPMDFGWGTYRPTDHHVVGDSIYIIKVRPFEYRKLAIIEKDAPANTWHFKYARLDGTDLHEVTINANDYSSKKFVNYSIFTDQLVNNQPDASDWQLLFVRFFDETIPHNLTGVLTKEGVAVQEVSQAGLDQATYTNFDFSQFSENINTIGTDWKVFDHTTFSYQVRDDVVYFVRELPNGAVWKLYFTDFGGASNGIYKFMQEKISDEGMQEDTKAFLNVYPNPATSNINVIYDIDGLTHISIVNMTGQQVFSKEVEHYNQLNKHTIDINDLPAGIYHLIIEGAGKRSTSKFVKQ